MRIGFMLYGSLDTLTGGYLYDRAIVSELRKRGHHLTIISLPVGSYLQRLLGGLPHRILKQIPDEPFDVIIQDELCHPSLVLFNSMHRNRSGTPVVALVHHLFSLERRNPLLNWVFSLIERRYLNSVDGFIFNSATTRSAVTSLTSRAKPEVVAYPSGNRFTQRISVEEIANRAHAPGPLQLLFVGTVIPRKGLAPLLHALHKLDTKYWHLTIVGDTASDPAYSKNVKALITSLGIKESVDFLGVLADDDLVEVLKTGHIFCMPFAYEGFGIAMAEAMSFGQPPLASSQGAAQETVKDGENGYLIAPGQHKKVREILTALYHDRTQLIQLSSSAYRTIEQAPDWQEAADGIERMLLNLVTPSADLS